MRLTSYKMVSYENCKCNEMTSLADASCALLGRMKHCTIAALIVLGLVAYLGVIGSTSKQVLSPSSHPLNPKPL